MHYSTLLKISLIPSALLAIFSFLALALTAVYWIYDDWLISKWSEWPIEPGNPDSDVNTLVVYLTSSSTDASIVSGVFGITAAIISILAWKTLRRDEMDNAFYAPNRRFWTGSAIFSNVAAMVAALAALVCYFADSGPDEYGCTTTVSGSKPGDRPDKAIGKDDKPLQVKFNFVNSYCSQERAVCNLLPEKLLFRTEVIEGDRTWIERSETACGMVVTTKWMQLILILFGFLTVICFSMQAWQRRNTRYERGMKDHFSPIGRY